MIDPIIDDHHTDHKSTQKSRPTLYQGRDKEFFRNTKNTKMEPHWFFSTRLVVDGSARVCGGDRFCKYSQGTFCCCCCNLVCYEAFTKTTTECRSLSVVQQCSTPPTRMDRHSSSSTTHWVIHCSFPLPNWRKKIYPRYTWQQLLIPPFSCCVLVWIGCYCDAFSKGFSAYGCRSR
jgi:hypothetical protein